MTKRLPFARVELDSIGSMVLRCGQGGHVFWDSDKGYLQRAADLINAANDKAVREAVKVFRERAARICEDSVKWYPRGNISECTKTPHELAAEIRALPTETEGK